MKIPFFHKKRQIQLVRRREEYIPKSFSKVRSKFLSKDKFSSLRSSRRIFIIVLLCILLLLGWFINSIYVLITFKPSKAYRDNSEMIDDQWKGDDRVNILLVGLDRKNDEFAFVDALFLLVVDPNESSIGIFNINVDAALYDTATNEYIPLRKVYNYAVLSNSSVPIEVLINKAETLLSVRIDRYLLTDEEGIVRLVNILNGILISSQKDLQDEDISSTFHIPIGTLRLGGDDFLGFLQVDEDGFDNKMIRQIEGLKGLLQKSTGYVQVIRLPQFLDIFERNVFTNMTKYEILRLGYEVMKVDVVNVGYSGIHSFQKEKNNGNIYYVPIYEKFDEDIQSVFIDGRIGKEQARVEVFNGTNIRGLASFKARWMRNIGIDVIRVGDSSYSYDETTIFTKDEEKYSDTIHAIKRMTKESIVIEDGKPDFITTGDIVVIIGNNVEK